ncbi:MAG: tetratricopeptide repeat protein [Desulfobacteraceae bacterium]|nr:MAG: tetratricopeptide repeat protein [Desulfobacteraceae bacterium]
MNIKYFIKSKTFPEGSYRVLPVFLLLTFLIFSIYYQTITYDFISYDDEMYITSNPHVLSGLNMKNMAWAFTTSWASNWHPVTWISHMADVQVFGMNSGAHHFVNMMFHIMNSLLIFFLFRKMTSDYWQSCFIAVLFAVHPLHVESVAWVSERKDVLSTFWGLLTLWNYIRYVDHPGVYRYGLMVLFFSLGLMAKPMLVTLPFVFILLDYWPLKRFYTTSSLEKGEEKKILIIMPFFRLWLEKFPLMIIAAGSCMITIWAQQQGGAVGTAEVFPVWDRVVNALTAYIFYIEKMVWPFGLAVIYPYPSSFPVYEFVRVGFLFAVISILAFSAVKRFPYIIVGWLWYIGTLVPVIGLIQVGSQSMADRYTYIPLIGLFIIISWGIPDLTARWIHKKKIITASALIICVCMAASAHTQTRYWKNSIRLFQHALEVTSGNWIAYNNIGYALSIQGLADQAIGYFQEALRINPEYHDARFNLGVALVSRKRFPEAIHQFYKVLKNRPDDKDVHLHLGRIFSLYNQFDKAVKHFTRASELDPDNAGVYNNIGVLYAKKGNFKKAIYFFQKAMIIQPDYPEAAYNLKRARGALRESVVTE